MPAHDDVLAMTDPAPAPVPVVAAPEADEAHSVRAALRSPRGCWRPWAWR